MMVASLVVGFDIDFACMLISDIQERDFKTSTIYPFPCLIFSRCAGMLVFPLWHCDKLIWPTGTLDIVLVQDVINLDAP